METMRYQESKKSAKGPIIGLLLFLLIGGGIIFFAIANEQEPVVVGASQSDTQSLMKVDENTTAETETKLVSYSIFDKVITDKTDPTFKANITLPVISVDGEELTTINEEIYNKYNNMYTTLKEKMSASSEYKYTYTVTYKKYENMLGDKKIATVTIYERIVDDSAKKNSMETINAYNIDLSNKTVLSQKEVAVELLGPDYKEKMKEQIKEYVVSKGYVASDAYSYTCTGLEKFYIKEGEYHILFNSGDLVDEKYSIIDIAII